MRTGARVRWLAGLSIVAALGLAAQPTGAQVPKPIPKPIPKPLPRPVPTPSPAAAPPSAAKPSPSSLDAGRKPPARPARTRSTKPPVIAIPNAVRLHMATACAKAGGVTSATQASLLEADLNGDGIGDYVVDERRLRCAAASAPAADTLSPVSLFVRDSADGDAQELIKATAFQVQIDRTTMPASVLLDMSGPECGNAPPQQRCRNRMLWSVTDRRFFYGPRMYIGATGQLSATPDWPPLAADLPAQFAAGTFKLGSGKKGVCARFYTDQPTRTALAAAYNASDWNGVARQVIAIGCNTDLGWYFLGVSAERLGKTEAAKVYYRAALARAAEPTFNIYSSCKVMRPNGCMGVNLVTDATEDLQRLSQETR